MPTSSRSCAPRYSRHPTSRGSQRTSGQPRMTLSNVEPPKKPVQLGVPIARGEAASPGDHDSAAPPRGEGEVGSLERVCARLAPNFGPGPGIKAGASAWNVNTARSPADLPCPTRRIPRDVAPGRGSGPGAAVLVRPPADRAAERQRGMERLEAWVQREGLRPVGAKHQQEGSDALRMRLGGLGWNYATAIQIRCSPREARWETSHNAVSL
jgi:hypothetical protein